MTIKQLSIFIENKGGALIRALELLGKNDIQILASTLADTKDYGIYRVICDNPARAYLLLKEEGVNLQLTDVNAIYVDNVSGEAARVMKMFSDSDIHIAYMYSFLLKGKGVLIFRTSDPNKTNEIITIKKLQPVFEDDLKQA